MPGSHCCSFSREPTALPAFRNKKGGELRQAADWRGSLHAGGARIRLLPYGERMDLLLPPREGIVSSIRILILLASAALGGTGATRLPAGTGPGQGDRCRGTWRGQRPSTARHRAGGDCCPFGARGDPPPRLHLVSPLKEKERVGRGPRVWAGARTVKEPGPLSAACSFRRFP